MVTGHQNTRGRQVSFLDLALLTGLALAVRLIGVGIDHHPVGDEMFHILAAQSWATDGTLAIADGAYTRAAWYTKLVGALFLLLGNSLVVARLPALVFGVLWPLLLFVWVNRNAGRLPAWIAAGLFAIAPHAIELSLYSRMYTMHGFFFLLASMIFFQLLTGKQSLSKALLLSAVFIVSLALAMHLQLTTAVGLIALFLAALADLTLQNRDRLMKSRFAVISLLSISALAILGIGVLYLFWDTFEPLWKTFLFTAFANRDADIRYYHKILVASYPVLWLLTPFAAIIAIYRNPRFALFCVIVFVFVLFVHSISGRKAERYVYYAMPFLFAIWGMAVAWLIPPLNRLLDQIAEKLRADYIMLGSGRSFGLAFKTLFSLIGIAFIVSGSGAFARTAHILNGESYYFGVRLSNWEKATPYLQDLIREAPVVLTTNFPKTLYYFGRYDVAFSPVIVADVLRGEEGGLDFRTGRPAIGTVESLRQLLDEHPHGVFVAESSEWRNRFRMTDEAADLLEQYARPVDLPGNARIVAYTW